MATHLSESSVNSLLRFINKADTSGSYNEKVDLLKKSGILVGGHEYAKVPKQTPAVPSVDLIVLIPNATSEKLSNFFVDGTYNFTYILFPTEFLQNGAIGTGKNVISSNYDSSTKLLDKKEIVTTFSDSTVSKPHIELQSFDIKSNYMIMNTLGTSLTGNFEMFENYLEMSYKGYDGTTGTFTNFFTIYQKTQIGFAVANYNSTTGQIHSVWYHSIVPATTTIVVAGGTG
jgi:hypothetical protein